MHPENENNRFVFELSPTGEATGSKARRVRQHSSSLSLVLTLTPSPHMPDHAPDRGYPPRGQRVVERLLVLRARCSLFCRSWSRAEQSRARWIGMMTSAAAVGAGLDSRYYFFFLFLIYGTATDILAGSRTCTKEACNCDENYQRMWR